MADERIYAINGQRVTAEDYARHINDSLAAGLCVHAYSCEHTTSPEEDSRG